MDDFVLTNLYESRNEWCSRLVNIFTPLVIEGIRSIFNESWQICIDNNEISKYLMTFQNLLCRVPKWNSVIVENERIRIIERSGCNYLEDLITCVHIIQLKVLTSVRVGNKQKKIDITIPKLDNFIHKIYIAVARKVYSNVYLFEKNISALNIQKNNRELEIIVQECILKTIQESIPTSEIIRAYLDESVEQEEIVTIENIENPDFKENNETVKETFTEKENDNIVNEEKEELPTTVPTIKNIDNEPVITRLTFNDIDTVLDEEDNIQNIEAPKSIEQLEKQSIDRMMNKKNDDDDDDDDDGRIKIHNDTTLDDITLLDIQDANNNIKIEEPLELDFDVLS
jgi:hypothetical protein